jgi:esterase/lipase superfamily enzyme
METQNRETIVNEIPLFIIDKLRPLNVEDEQNSIDDYIAISTATRNVEDVQDDDSKKLTVHSTANSASEEKPNNLTEQTYVYLNEIARRLIVESSQIDSQDPEIVIAVHGFNNNYNAVRAWYNEIHEYTRNKSTFKNKNIVFIGYRWPSENFSDLQFSLPNALTSLPITPRFIFYSGILLSSLALLFLSVSYSKLILVLLIAIVVLTSLILTLILLRLMVYFRDSYRAAYFGTPDLVELVRQIDKAISKQNQNRRVKLSFLGHSMGCTVITNTIRILSDVFDSESIGEINAYQPNKKTQKESKEIGYIGKNLNLKRLVLVAPDIPVESVIPRRSNFLRSALRRFSEAHVFTNEGDMALRLASTAANYFSFPARTRFSGYRLGNLTVKHFNDCNDKIGKIVRYGIVNNPVSSEGYPFQHLEIRSSDNEHRNLNEEPFYPWIAKKADDVTNQFCYFDCTDYTDSTDANDKTKGVVSLAIGKPAINFRNYFTLLCAYMTGKIDTHGGYFKGRFSKDAIYHLAFGGFTSFCISLPKSLDDICHEKNIQVLLSPLVTYPPYTTSISSPSSGAVEYKNGTPIVNGLKLPKRTKSE